MNDDNSKVRAQDMTSTDTDSENPNQENTNPRVFDITPDLNIAPAKEEDDNEPTQIPSNETQNITKIPEIVDITEKNVSTVSVNIPTNQKELNPNNLGEITINKDPEPAKNGFTGQLKNNPVTQTNTFGPANPPAKTIGMNKISFNKEFVETAKNTEPANLQDAVSSIKLTPDQKIPTTIPPRPYESKKDGKIKPLRTYETDFAEAISKKHITTTSAVIAEKNKIQNEPKIQKTDIAVPIPPYKDSPKKESEFFVNKTPKTETKELPINTTSNYENPLFTKKPVSLDTQPTTTNFIKNNLPINQQSETPVKDFEKNTSRNIQEPKQSKNIIKNTILVIISIILLGGGLYAGYYLYTKSPLSLVQFSKPKNTNPSEPQFLEPKSIFPADTKTKISIDGKNRTQIINDVKKELDKAGKENTIEEIILTKTENNIIEKIGANDLNNIIQIDAPSLITRSLNDDYMLGIYNGIGGQKSPFIITTNNFFQNAFAGMIEWEKNIPTDLKEFLYNNNNQFTLKGVYKDKIIKNKDVREYVSDNDHVIFLYSFLSNDKMIITNNEIALENIIIRLEKNAFVR